MTNDRQDRALAAFAFDMRFGGAVVRVSQLMPDGQVMRLERGGPWFCSEKTARALRDMPESDRGRLIFEGGEE